MEGMKKFTKSFATVIADTYYNDDAYKATIQRLIDEIDSALQMKDQDWFERASREYRALKMEGVR